MELKQHSRKSGKGQSRMLRVEHQARQSSCRPRAFMKAYIIFNPRAGSVTDRKKIAAQLKRLKPIAIKMTRRSGDAERWARAGFRRNGDGAIAAGGDGHFTR